jgi:uncharacterized protein with HEPN domain
MKKDPIIYIEHISACISRIKEYTEGIDEDGFLKNNLIQDAVIRNFDYIGVDLWAVWGVVENIIPTLDTQIEDILRKEQGL